MFSLCKVNDRFEFSAGQTNCYTYTYILCQLSMQNNFFWMSQKPMLTSRKNLRVHFVLCLQSGGK